MGDMSYCPVLGVVAEYHGRFPVYRRDSAFSVFIEHHPKSKGLFTYDVDGY